MDTINLIKRLKSLCNAKNDSKVKDLYKLLLKKELYYNAYQNIYANNGGFTEGLTDDTLDNFNQERIDKIIESIRNDSYNPIPVKRILIEKANGNLRPLGISTGTDKLIQESCRIILDAVYDGKFSDKSFGFRKNRSCISALGDITTWAGTTWFIEFDIKGCFDNIDHKILLNLLRKRIDDEKFIRIIKKFLKAGYVEHWKYNETYSGTPQGNIISPILSNIYLDELDKYVEKEIIPKYTKGTKKKITKEYRDLTNRCTWCRKKILKYENEVFPKYNKLCDLYYSKQNEESDDILYTCLDLNKLDRETRQDGYWDGNLHYRKKTYLVNKLSKLIDMSTKDINFILDLHVFQEDYDKNKKELIYYVEKKLKTKHSIDDNSYSRLRYCRYADDFLFGYIGNIKDSHAIKSEITEFLKCNLNLEISEEKTKVISARNGIIFLGYEISKWDSKNQYIYVTDKNGHTFKKNRNRTAIKFTVPTSKMISFVKRNRYGNYQECISERKTGLMNFDIYEIVKQYNSELRGLSNYYRYAYDWKEKVGRVQWIMNYSMLKTLAGKYRCSVAKLFKNKIIKINSNKTWYIEYGDNKILEIFKISIIETKHPNKEYVNVNDTIQKFNINVRNSAIKKMISNTCEICGNTKEKISIHLHHKTKIGNTNNDSWNEKINKFRNRKTITTCEKCHNIITSNQNKLHN